MASDVQAPVAEDPGRVLGWMNEATQEGENFVKSQDGYDDIARTIKVIMNRERPLKTSTLSTTTVNHLGKIAEDLVAMLTDTKPFWEFRTWNKRFEPTAQIYGKLSEHWYRQRFIDLHFADVIRYALVGCGFAHLRWAPELSPYGDITLDAEDPRDILPVRPSDNFSMQNAYGGIIRRARTVNYLRGRYGPELWHLIKADRDGSATSSLQNTRIGRMFSEYNNAFRQRLFGGNAVKELPRIPTADYYEAYVKDESRNESGQRRYMGDFDKDGKPQNNWSYTVESGEKLYPRGRFICYTRYGVLRDGPNPYWHGMIPIPKLSLSPWPWSWMGKGLLWDILPLQNSYDLNVRVMEDHNEQLARPGAIADKNSVSKAELDKLDTRRPGWRIRQNPLAGKGIVIQPPPPIGADSFKHRELTRDEMYLLSGVRDMQQLKGLGQLPAPETVERIMETMSESVKLRSRIIEAFVTELATMLAYNFAQFYGARQRAMILGAQGLTMDDFDQDPYRLVPAFVNASDFDDFGRPKLEALTRGPLPEYERAKEFMLQFSFHIAKGSLLAASEIERKLLYLQLSRAGLIDHWSLLEIMGIPNVGNPPDGANTITDRLIAEQQMGLGMAISAAGRKASGQSLPRTTVKES